MFSEFSLRRSLVNSDITAMQTSQTELAEPPDFAFNILEEKMTDFLTQFDAFIEHGRNTIQQRRQQWEQDMAEDQELVSKTKNEIQFYQEKQANLEKGVFLISAVINSY
jgi:uncharacterized protein YlxW (UPF0749 family)